MPAPDRKRRLTAFAVAMAVLIATPLAVVAADAFNDVPNSNVHHDDITWLRDNGVTFGCNPPANTEFCPGDAVLRQQMASFMRRLAENHVVDAATALEANHATTADSATTADTAATADDANSVEGNSSTELSSRLVGTFRDGGNGVDVLTVNSGTPTALGSISIEADNGPLALVTYNLYGLASGDMDIVMWLQRDNDACDTDNRILGSLARQDAPTGEFHTVAGSIATATTGDPDITLCVEPQAGTSLGIRDFQLNGLTANVGSTPVEVAGGGDPAGTSDDQ